ncbi:MAG TPA: hypothetical protein PKN11_03810 [Anaerolineaceae bacterium]|nr:hypothetical protein [Anaerolineaceae bacterium]
MKSLRRWLSFAVLLTFILGSMGVAGQGSLSVRAETEPAPETPIRKTTLTVNYTAHEWWLVRWSDNDIACRLVVEHEGVPISGEVLTFCGKTVHTTWLKTTPCDLNQVGGDMTQCPGMYFFEAGSWQASREVEVELPLPAVWITLDGCNEEPGQNRCLQMPTLRLTAEEPLPNETIISISGVFNGEGFTCSGSTCLLPLQATSAQGLEMEFWAESSFGDSSEHYTALVRVQPWGDFMDPEGMGTGPQLWFADVISSQWRGGALATCSDIWQVFPEIGGPPAWLSSPAGPEDLYSSYSLYFLAGMLIQNQQVDASSCPNGGLASPTVANECGVDVAYDAVVAWQNQFDAEIFQVSQDLGVPAQLLKNVFSRESQFWPGIYKTYQEAGLGQLTANGADTMLLWNPEFYSQFCPLVLHVTRCELGFGNLDITEQEMLSGALVRKVNASCPDCPVGIDLTQANFSVRVFAEGLLANCEQVGRLITNITRYQPRQVSSYVDLWQFTLANYNAGPGCLSEAIREAWKAAEPLDWEHVAPRLDPACRKAVDYVNDISQVLGGITPTPTSWVYLGTPVPALTVVGVRTPTPLPTATRTPSPTNTPGPSPTPGPTQGYPVDTPTPASSTTPGYP